MDHKTCVQFVEILGRDSKEKRWMPQILHRLSTFAPASPNKRKKTERFPIPQNEDILDKMAGSVVFSKFDLSAGFRRIKLEDPVQELTAITM